MEQGCSTFGAGRGPVEMSRVEPGAFCERADGCDEVAAACGVAVVQVRRPEDGALAVDEEAAGCVAVADDAVCADAERVVRECLIGCAPAVRVALPAELGECLVEYGWVSAGRTSRS